MRTSRRARRCRGKGGFTMVELLVVVSILGILVGFAIPNMRSVLMRARAAEVIADIDVVRVAAVQYQADALDWPPDAASGEVPSELVGYLPSGFRFERNGYRLAYRRYDFHEGLPEDPEIRGVIALTVTTEAPELGHALIQLLGGSILFSAGNTHLVVIDRM